MDYKNEIDRLLTNSKGRVIDVFYELYFFICSLNADQQYDAFRYLCENAKRSKVDNSNLVAVKTHFTQKRLDKCLDRLNKRFIEEIESIIVTSSKTNIPTEDFYRSIWDLIQSNKICKNKHEKSLALFIFVDNDLIPYIPVGTGLSMNEEEYSSIIDSLDSITIKQTEMIMQIDYDQKTQKSSLLIEKMQNLSFEEQSVYLSIVLDILEKRIKDEIRSKIDSI